MFTCTGAELDGMLRGASGPTDWEARRAARSRGIADAPAQLGPPEAPPPDLAWLPAEMARAMRALDVYMSAMAEAPPPPAPPPAPEATPALAGLGVSAGVCEGFARVCGTVHDIARLQPGDVLVAATTTPAINVVLPLLGAIVTDRGGALSHAAIVTREYGIPGVVGTREATRRIADGARVRVDGTTGRVEILA